jgi:hypothetical protein
MTISKPSTIKATNKTRNNNIKSAVAQAALQSSLSTNSQLCNFLLIKKKHFHQIYQLQFTSACLHFCLGGSGSSEKQVNSFL